MKLYKFDKESLAYKEVNLIKLITGLIGVFAVTIVLSSFIAKEEKVVPKNTVKYIETEKTINLVTNETFDIISFTNELKKLNFKYPEIVMAQAICESGFNSPIFKENNNLFGMKEARSRMTTATGTNRNHATYDNWKMCVVDRMLYEAVYLNKLSRKQYLAYLDKLYSETSGYSKTLEEIIKKRNLKKYFKDER